MASTHTGIVHQPPGQTTIEHLPLEEVTVNAWVVDVSARIVLAQTFYNYSAEPTGRAKYVFPLPANAAVCAFELEMGDGSIITGEVKEKDEAVLQFTQAVEEGKAAALVERVTDDIFTISLGPIPAASRVIARLTFVMDLSNEGLTDHVRLQLPMHIAGRYGTPPAEMQNTSAANPQTRVHISVDIQTSDVIYDIRSPTHTRGIERRRYKGQSGRPSERRMSVIWKSSEFLTSDFVITIHAGKLDEPRCFAEVYGPTIAMQLTLVPKFQAPKIPSQEYIFVIDRSGSMQGASIDTAKRTLNMLLRLLPRAKTTFNIFGFGSTVKYLWKRSRTLDVASLNEAILHVENMDADLGGTEICQALQSAFDSRGLDRPAAVFVLTDGEIYQDQNLNPYVIIANAVQNSPPHAPIRLFVLGIGTGVSSDVCSRLAHQGNGEYMFALSSEDIFAKCARLLDAGRSRNIERVDIDWGNNTPSTPIDPSASTAQSLPAGITSLAPPPPVQQAPHSLTKIFSGIRFSVFAITTFKTIPDSVLLATKLDGVSEPQELRVKVTKVKPFRDTEAHSALPMIHTLAARKLIQELDYGSGPLPSPAPEDALLVSQDDLRKAGIIRLGLKYQLASKHTSFIAVQMGNERRRVRGRRSGNTSWAGSRLQATDTDSQDDPNPIGEPTFLDSLINGVSYFVTSVFGLFSNPAALASVANMPSDTRSHHRPGLPGTYDSDSDTDDGRGRRSQGRTSSVPRRRSSSHGSVASFSTLSSLDGSSCSACWTPSRSPSPLPHFRDTTERAPSPIFFRDPSTQGARPADAGPSHAHHPIPQEVYDLFQQMDIDGSFTQTPLLTQLVGNAVFDKADDLAVDRTVWATVVVVAYLRRRLQGEPNLMNLMSEKAWEFVEASEWFKRGGRETKHFDEMIRQAEACLPPIA